jgi:hypothetical protein
MVDDGDSDGMGCRGRPGGRGEGRGLWFGLVLVWFS